MHTHTCLSEFPVSTCSTFSRGAQSIRLVVYVPSCLALVRGGYFARRGRGAAGGWDTLTSAQQLLKGVMDAHGPLLQSLPVLPVPGRAARRQQQQQHEPRQADKPAKVEEGQGQGQGQAGGSGLLEEGSGSASGAGGGGGRTLQDVALRGLSSDDNVSDRCGAGVKS